MGNHVHVSALSFLIVALYIIVFGITWRFLSTKFSDSPVGKAMGVIF
jgi:hypothetical protein